MNATSEKSCISSLLEVASFLAHYAGKRVSPLFSLQVNIAAGSAYAHTCLIKASAAGIFPSSNIPCSIMSPEKRLSASKWANSA